MSRLKYVAPNILGFVSIAMGLLLPCSLSSSAFGGLYECTDGSGSRIFTDRPAQLQRCSPLPTSQSQQSSAPAPQAAAPLTYQNALPAAIDPPPAPFTAPQDNVGSNQVAPQPCTPGFNPLNPLAAPPCHQSAPGQGGAAPRLN